MQNQNDSFWDEAVTFAEATAALEVPPGTLEDLMTADSPFQRLPDGRITLRSAFGCGLSLLLTMFDTERTATIAWTAARDACIGKSRRLVLEWTEGGTRIQSRWFDQSEALPLRPVLVICPDQMLGLLQEHVSAYRLALVRPN